MLFSSTNFKHLSLGVFVCFFIKGKYAEVQDVLGTITHTIVEIILLIKKEQHKITYGHANILLLD